MRKFTSDGDVVWYQLLHQWATVMAVSTARGVCDVYVVIVLPYAVRPSTMMAKRPCAMRNPSTTTLASKETILFACLLILLRQRLY